MDILLSNSGKHAVSVSFVELPRKPSFYPFNIYLVESLQTSRVILPKYLLCIILVLRYYACLYYQSIELSCLYSILPLKTTPLIRPSFRCTEIVKCYSNFPLKRGHPSFKATFSLQKAWPYKRETTVLIKYINVTVE